ncbi:alpha/beta hydrolase [Halomonas chromatireducens]|uniref:Alpha/beta hydrolase family protein n=1 Tax=Halomonas chromatireducens TaxID=507626 RepID=A0A0X8HDA2_9GAMM|nr:alpha/beta fold hydrolase [Halomonas chromatireducens]AMD00395.1 Alpha/beta hydrolase family protein [Halomonas chromatireducens]
MYLTDPATSSKEGLAVVLSHGLESGPSSTKMQALTAVAESFDNVHVVVMDYRGMETPEERLSHLMTALEQLPYKPEQTILAGSSMGGWVSAAASSHIPVLGCFLMAPAFGLERYPDPAPVIRAQHVQIIHGWQDTVVPPGPVIELAQQQCVPLRLVDDNHRLEVSLNILIDAFEYYLKKILVQK